MLSNPPLQRTNGSVASLPLPFAAERQYRWTDMLRVSLLAMALLGFGCAHAESSKTPTLRCGERRVALRVAHDLASETERSDRVKLRLDESRVVDEPHEWKLVTIIDDGAVPRDAYLVVRKLDCAVDWLLRPHLL